MYIFQLVVSNKFHVIFRDVIKSRIFLIQMSSIFHYSKGKLTTNFMIIYMFISHYIYYVLGNLFLSNFGIIYINKKINFINDYQYIISYASICNTHMKCLVL